MKNENGGIVFDGWELEVPTESGNGNMIIHASQLIGGYSSDFFHPPPGGSGPLTIFCNSAASPQSKPRVTLKETYDKYWQIGGKHVLSGSCVIVKAPSHNGVTLAEVRSSDADGRDTDVMILYWKPTNKLAVTIRKDSNPSDLIDVCFGNFSVGQTITFTLSFASNTLTMKVGKEASSRITVVSRKTATFKDPRWKKNKYYFTAGNCLMDISTPTSAESLVQFHNLSALHQA